MKIGYIIPTCGVSGGIAVICQHANRLSRRGHQLFLISTSKLVPMDWFPNQHVPVVHIDEWHEPLDIVVATGWSTSFLLNRINAMVKCYFVQSDETRFHPPESRWRHLAALTYFYGVNYLTEARWIQRWLAETFGHKVELIPNGLDPDIFFQGEPLQPRGKRPRILLEGAINLPYKGMSEAFEVVSSMDVDVWCVSSYGTPKAGWKCDRFFEHIPMVDMRKIYSSCDILLKLSRVEGFFGPPMEMMACGGVSVVGKVSGYDEYIVDGHNALVVDPVDITGARSAIQRLIDDADLRSRLVEAGKQTSRQWSWEPSIDILEAYYQRLLSNPTAWASSTRRPDFDESISYMYHFVSRGIFPEELAADVSSCQVPFHAQKLAAYLASKRAFWSISGAVKFVYNVVKKLKNTFRACR